MFYPFETMDITSSLIHTLNKKEDSFIVFIYLSEPTFIRFKDIKSNYVLF
jgi:hypothetical protein